MKPNKFYAPVNLQELVELLKMKKSSVDFYFVAGATDFLIDIRRKGVMEYTAVDLTHMDEMKEIVNKDGYIEIGASVTMAMLEKSTIVCRNANAIAEAAGRVGSTQIRNRATIGGNIANASHCADLVTASFALGATVVLLNSDGGYRELLMEEFILGSGRTKIEPDEVLFKIRIGYGSAHTYSSFSKVGSRKNVTISKLNHAVRLVFSSNYVTEAAIYIGSIGPKAIKAVNMEEHCIGRKWDDSLRAELMEFGSIQVDEAIPTRSSRIYKRTAIKGVICDIFKDIEEQRVVI